MGEVNPLAHQAAIDMLRAFGSVGASRFDVTWTNSGGEKQQFRRGVDLDKLQAGIPAALDHATAQRHNLIVRPHAPPVFLQLDDLDGQAVQRVRPAAFLILNTSPGNHQAWLALSGAADEDLARRVRKGAGADPTASGATRVAGSLNFKDKYAPDFPRVEIGHLAPGRVVTPAELDAMRLVAEPEPVRPARAAPPGRVTGGRRWPDYQRCLDGAPANTGGDGPDVSRADFTFAMIAADWGWSIEDVAHRLTEESPKARENGPGYARLTATKAAAAAARRNGRPGPGLPQHLGRG